MSAYMVDQEHINVMVWAAAHLTEGPVFFYRDAEGETQKLSGMDTETLTRAGQALVDANAASMAANYGEHDHGYQYHYSRPQRTDWTPVDVLNAMRCYEYQAGDAKTYPTSEAARFCESLRHGLICRLPGMDLAPWEIRPETVPAYAAA